MLPPSDIDGRSANARVGYSGARPLRDRNLAHQCEADTIVFPLDRVEWHEHFIALVGRDCGSIVRHQGYEPPAAIVE